MQCDLWEPKALIPVGHGQLRRGYVVTVELCWSRLIAGALVFSKEAPDILAGFGTVAEGARIGVLPERLVWDREGAIHAGGGRPTQRVRLRSAASSPSAGSSWRRRDRQLQDRADRRSRLAHPAQLELAVVEYLGWSTTTASTRRSQTSRPSSSKPPTPDGIRPLRGHLRTTVLRHSLTQTTKSRTPYKPSLRETPVRLTGPVRRGWGLR